MKSLQRCHWADTNELFIPYHDDEWGEVVHDDRLLFEMLNLEGAQAGLSWLTVLRKRATYIQAFDNFDAKKIVAYDDTKRAELMSDAGIVRNRLKINATIENAKAYLQVQKEYGSFDAYIWQFVNNKQLTHKQYAEAVAISEVMSKEMKKRGFKFVGSTICYAFMQAMGMINDHEPYCFKA
ncbi:MAG: DNA-3-methyladenine glycosylase [Candidatus Saccharibacteria bacterium]|nr:DNA-3-methyladenine glycosylase [Candidatus Saccharibacteria bacterium]